MIVAMFKKGWELISNHKKEDWYKKQGSERLRFYKENWQVGLIACLFAGFISV